MRSPLMQLSPAAWLRRGTAAVALLLFAAPLLLMLGAALRAPDAAPPRTFAWWPEAPGLAAFAEAFVLVPLARALLNSLLLTASTNSEADIIAIVASPTNDGIAVVPGVDGIGFFTVAGVNIGNGRTLRVEPVANGGVPVSLSICETTGNADGSCLQPPGSSRRTTFLPDQVKTYTVFVAGTGTPIPMDLANSRVTVRAVSPDSGIVRGATSIAVQTGPAGMAMAAQ